jgi:hypothetical protein
VCIAGSRSWLPGLLIGLAERAAEPDARVRLRARHSLDRQRACGDATVREPFIR